HPARLSLPTRRSSDLRWVPVARRGRLPGGGAALWARDAHPSTYSESGARQPLEGAPTTDAGDDERKVILCDPPGPPALAAQQPHGGRLSSGSPVPRGLHGGAAARLHARP